MVISCSISCSIYDDRAKLHFEIALPITVGDNVWIGANVISIDTAINSFIINITNVIFIIKEF